MKKSLLAVALMGAFSGLAYAQSSVTIYGIVDAGVKYDNNGGQQGAKTSLDSGIEKGSRLGFKGTEDLGGGLKANFVLEMGLQADTGASDQGGLAFGRQAYLGLAGDFGSLNLGRQKSLTYVASEAIDPFATGGLGNMNLLFKTVTRRNNAVTYVSNNIEGFTGSVQYGFGEVAGNTSANRTLAVSGSYAAGPLLANLTYEKVTDANGNDDVDGKKLLIGATYDFGTAKAHFAFENMKGSTSATNLTGTEKRVWMIGATVPLSAEDSIVADFTRLNDKVADDANANQLALGYSHALSKRTNVYAQIARTANDSKAQYNAGAAGATDKALTVGLRHVF